MNRRAVLSVLGTGLASFAGCSVIDPGTAAETDTERSPRPTQTPAATPEYPEPEPGDSLLVAYDPAGTAATVEVGDPDRASSDAKPYTVNVWNTAGQSRTLALRVSDRTEGPLVETTFDVAADHAVPVTLVEPSDYVLDVWLPETDDGASLRVGRGRFDCNASWTVVRVSADAEFTSSSFTTLVQCSSDETA